MLQISVCDDNCCGQVFLQHISGSAIQLKSICRIEMVGIIEPKY